MEIVKIEKERALERLRENRAKHRDLYEKALEGWRDMVLGEIIKIAEDLKAGKIPSLLIHHTPPVDYTKDYDTAIEMLEFSISDTVELSFKDFKSYMRDDWQWKRDFLASNSSYAAEYYEEHAQ